jgi:hypothetical protein
VQHVSNDESGLETGPENTVDDMPPIPPVSDPVATARRRHGAAGAVLAAGMFGVDIALGRKPKEEAPVVVTASGDPTDIDRDGMNFALDAATQVVAPPLPPSNVPVAPAAKARRKKG